MSKHVQLHPQLWKRFACHMKILHHLAISSTCEGHFIHFISQLQQHVICIVPGQRKACCWNDASYVDWQSRFVDRVPILPIDH